MAGDRTRRPEHRPASLLLRPCRVAVALLLATALTPTAATARRQVRPRNRPAAHRRVDRTRQPEPPTAGQLVEEARRLGDAGAFAEAADRWERAYRLHPDRRILYDLGRTREALGQRDRALCLLERFVAPPPPAEDPVVADARRRIPSLATTVSRIAVAAPAGAQLFLDGQERGVAPLERPLCALPGLRRVVGVSLGFAPIGIDVAAVAGETVRVTLDPAAHRAVNLDEAPVPSVTEPPWWSSPGVWIAAGVLVSGALAVGLYSGLQR